MADPAALYHPSRRLALIGLAATGAALPLPAKAEVAAVKAAAPLPTGPLCRLLPQSEEGPFYLDPKLDRSAITEGRPGVPLTLELTVIDGAACTPLADARVDLWHADAQGLYSMEDGQGDDRRLSTRQQTFLRGTQHSDAAGRVQFETIYPGWYGGRTPHIHVKIFLASREVLTGQLFLPDALSEFIYLNVRAYQGRVRERDTVNATDHVVQGADPEHLGFLAVREAKDRYIASLTIAVDRSAERAAAHPSPPPGPPPGFGPPPGPPPGGPGFGPPPDGPPPEGQGPPGGPPGAAPRLYGPDLVPGAAG